MSGNIDIGNLGKSLKTTGKQFARLRIPLFLLLLVGIYCFIVFRTYTLLDIAPDESAVTETSKTTRAHIDEDVAKKIQELQDNSVNVQQAFNEARNNPFQE